MNVFYASADPLKIQRDRVSHLASNTGSNVRDNRIKTKMPDCQGMAFHAKPVLCQPIMSRVQSKWFNAAQARPSQSPTYYASPSACDTKALYQFTLRSNQSQIHLIYACSQAHVLLIYIRTTTQVHLIISYTQVHVPHISTCT
jgi:hypothetical protein